MVRMTLCGWQARSESSLEEPADRWLWRLLVKALPTFLHSGLGMGVCEEKWVTWLCLWDIYLDTITPLQLGKFRSTNWRINIFIKICSGKIILPLSFLEWGSNWMLTSTLLQLKHLFIYSPLLSPEKNLRWMICIKEPQILECLQGIYFIIIKIFL